MAVSWLADDEIGRVLGDRYRLIDLIGAGGSAQVYLADDVQLRRRVAVKVLHAALASDQGFLRRFQAEAQAAAALNHPNVVAIYDWGRDGLPFIVTEYLSGGSLRDLIDRGHTLSPAQALLVGLEAARGLDYAHGRGLVHRDIKPGNLMFGEDRRLRIADFGLARALAAATWTEPAGSVLGTARYVSPEQATGGELDGRSDVFSLGLSMIESVTGVQPFADTTTTVETLRARLNRDIVIDPELGALSGPLHQATRRDPKDRHTARTFGLELIGAARQTNRPAPLPILTEAEPPLNLGDGDPTADAEDPASYPTIRIDEDGVHGTPRVEVAPLSGTPTIRATRAGDSDVGAGDLDADDLDAAHADRQDAALRDADGDSNEASSYPGLRVVEDDSDVEPLNPVRRITVNDPTPTASPDIIDAHRELRTKRLQRRRYIAMGAVLLLLVGMIAFAFIFQPEDRERLGNRLPAQLENTPTTDVPGFMTSAESAAENYEGRMFAEVRAEIEASDAAWSIQSIERASDVVPQGEIMDQDPEAGDALDADGRLMLVVSSGPSTVVVPSDLAGSDLESATTALADAGIAVGTIIEEPSDNIVPGTVMSVDQAGEAISIRDAAVDVTVSSGPLPLTVPDGLIGADVTTVGARLVELGLVPSATRVFSDDAAKDIVTGMDPVPGASVSEGDSVSLTVSKGPRYWEIPSVTGADVASARTALENAGFVVATDAPDDAIVTSMSPPAGDFHRKGTTITVSAASDASDDTSGDSATDE